MCGHHPLDGPPYENYLGIVPAGAKPPYIDTLGNPSCEVCSGCGFEYGYDDAGASANRMSFEEYREWWLAEGGEVFEPRPSG